MKYLPFSTIEDVFVEYQHIIFRINESGYLYYLALEPRQFALDRIVSFDEKYECKIAVLFNDMMGPIYAISEEEHVFSSKENLERKLVSGEPQILISDEDKIHTIANFYRCVLDYVKRKQELEDARFEEAETTRTEVEGKASVGIPNLLSTSHGKDREEEDDEEDVDVVKVIPPNTEKASMAHSDSETTPSESEGTANAGIVGTQKQKKATAETTQETVGPNSTYSSSETSPSDEDEHAAIARIVATAKPKKAIAKRKQATVSGGNSSRGGRSGPAPQGRGQGRPLVEVQGIGRGKARKGKGGRGSAPRAGTPSESIRMGNRDTIEGTTDVISVLFETSSQQDNAVHSVGIADLSSQVQAPGKRKRTSDTPVEKSSKKSMKALKSGFSSNEEVPLKKKKVLEDKPISQQLKDVAKDDSVYDSCYPIKKSTFLVSLSKMVFGDPTRIYRPLTDARVLEIKVWLVKIAWGERIERDKRPPFVLTLYPKGLTSPPVSWEQIKDGTFEILNGQHTYTACKQIVDDPTTSEDLRKWLEAVDCRIAWSKDNVLLSHLSSYLNDSMEYSKFKHTWMQAVMHAREVWKAMDKPVNIPRVGASTASNEQKKKFKLNSLFKKPLSFLDFCN